MHIKSITLSGFKSYRDPVTLVLAPGHNVVIGRNGYGKSNIFDAIRFVFGDQFGAMRVEDKSRLIFDQGNAQYIQASVSITLDNSDGRLPIEGAAVTLGRTVGLKKDEFFLGGKTVKKGDIQSLLESAGFSRANPYYIVAQASVVVVVLWCCRGWRAPGEGRRESPWRLRAVCELRAWCRPRLRAVRACAARACALRVCATHACAARLCPARLCLARARTAAPPRRALVSPHVSSPLARVSCVAPRRARWRS